MKIAAVVVQLAQPEVESRQVVVRALIWIPMEVTEVLHQHESWILFMFGKLRVLATLRNVEPASPIRLRAG